MINMIDNENSLIDVLQHIENFELFVQGEKRKITKGQTEFQFVLKKLEELFFCSRLMPAFCVSLHSDTIMALKQDEWLQINFNQELTKNGLPFSSLLFKLENVQGFNLIRCYNGNYSGRGLYLDLDNLFDLKTLI